MRLYHSQAVNTGSPPPPEAQPNSLQPVLIGAVVLVMMGEAGGGGGLPLSPPVVCSRCGGLSVALRSLYCAAHFFFTTCSKKKNGFSVHALADLHNAIPPAPATPQNKSGLRRIAAHRLRALYCCWIIQELAERKRQGEWGVCTLSPGETEAKEGASLEE